jgi:predicted nucleic acid-binding protein
MMASDRLFVDSGAWLAVIDPRDQHHEPARVFHRQAIEGRVQLVTTNLIVAETYTLLRRRIGQRTAIQFLDLIETSHRLTRVWSTPELEVVAEELLRKHDDQDFSYVDAVSFAAMEELGLKAAFAFDHHFEVMGFLRRPHSG